MSRHRSARPVTVLRAPEHLARRFQQVCDGVLAALFAEHGLANWQYALLVQVRTTPGLDGASLAAAIGRDPSSTGQALDMLVARGLVERRISPADGRAWSFVPTAAGISFHDAMRPVVTAASRRITAPLSPEERETLLDLLTRVVVANEEHARPGAGRRPPRRRGPTGAETGDAKPCATPASTSHADGRSSASASSSREPAGPRLPRSRQPPT